MLKVARSTLSIYRRFNSPMGVIKWDYRDELARHSPNLGLHLGNKSTSRHVNYENPKMKACLAAQTLSSSMAVALETLHDFGLPKFQGCLATADFYQED